jgi:hypothetical protein
MSATTGAFLFGAVIGWNAYFVNRYRKADVQLGDLAAILGVVGGAAVLALFPAGTELFSAYATGLAVGFFTYFIMLVILVMISSKFTFDWFLDGRRKKPADDEIIPEGTATTIHAMGIGQPGGRTGERDEMR